VDFLVGLPKKPTRFFWVCTRVSEPCVAVNCYCKNSPGSFGQSSTSARCLPIFGSDLRSTCRQLQYYTNHRHLFLLSPKADTLFTIPCRV